MLILLRIFFICIAAPSLLIATAIFLSVDNDPGIKEKWTLNHQDIQRATEILNHNFEQHTGLRSLKLTEKDLNIATNYLLNRYIQSTSQITLHAAGINFLISIQLPNNLFGKYLKIQFNLKKQNHLPGIYNLTFGNIYVADELAGILIENIIKHSRLNRYYILLSQHIKKISLNSDYIEIIYQASLESYRQTRNFLTDNTGIDALVVYQNKLNNIISEHDQNWRLSLAEVLQPLFKLALERSTAKNAIAENRAVIFIASAYVNNNVINKLLPDKLIIPIKTVPVYLYKRVDMSKHFIGSATLSASGSGILAHMLGLEKELDDANKGSGFSFIDLASDRAGMLFGEKATLSPGSAIKLQKIMAEISDYRAFMPDVTDLPENMNSSQFRTKFGSIYSREYREMLMQIDQRISDCPIYNKGEA